MIAGFSAINSYQNGYTSRFFPRCLSPEAVRMWMPGSLSFLQRCRLARSGLRLGGLLMDLQERSRQAVFGGKPWPSSCLCIYMYIYIFIYYKQYLPTHIYTYHLYHLNTYMYIYIHRIQCFWNKFEAEPSEQMEKILPLCRPESERKILPKYVGKRSFDKRTNMPRATKNRVNFHDYLPDAKRIAEKTYTNAEGVAHKVAVNILLFPQRKRVFPTRRCR